MEGIQVSVSTIGSKQDISLIRITGYIDTTTSSELERIIQNLLREQKFRIIIDLQSVDYISSAGWGIFISEIKNIRVQQGDLKLAGMSESVSEVYELLEFSTILTSAETVEDALKLFGDQPGAPDKAPVAVKKPAPQKAVRKPVVQPLVPPPRPDPQPVPAPVVSSKPEPPKVQQATVPISSESVAGSKRLLPVIDRIKAVVKSQPGWGAWKIKSELNRTRGTQPKVGWVEVKNELKYSNLDSKDARYRFARDL